MKLLNYDAPEELVIKMLEQAIPDFILEVIRKQETAFYHGNEFYLQMLCPLQRYEQGEVEERPLNECSLEIFTPISFDQCLNPTPIQKFTRASYRNIVSLLHTIPVYLREKNTRDDEGDLLGAYHPDKNNPYVELYVQDIWDTAKENNLHFKWLLTKALIHALAHAALDIHNLENSEFVEDKVRHFTRFRQWREEEVAANAITLRIIRDFGDSAFYAYAKAFMQEQDPEYTLDVEMENFEDADFDRVFKAKYLGVSMQKMHQLVIPENTKRITGQDYVFASAEDFIKWAVLPYAEINADGNPQVEFTPAYYQAKEECKSFVILNQDSKIIEDGKITFSIWLPKQCWEKYGTQKQEIILKIKIDSNRNDAISYLEYDFD